MKLVFVLSLAVAGCPSAPVAPEPAGYVEVPTVAPRYDAGSDRDGLGTTLGNVCFRLRQLGCPEGGPTSAGRTCYEHLMTLSAVTSVPAQCASASASVNDLRGCGDANSVRFRCLQ